MEANLNSVYLTDYYNDDKRLADSVEIQFEKNQHRCFEKLVNDIHEYIEHPNHGIKFSIDYSKFASAHAKAIQKPTQRDLQVLCGYRFDKGCLFSGLLPEIMHYILLINPLLNFNSFETILRGSYFKVVDEKVLTKKLLIKMKSTRDLAKVVSDQPVEQGKSCCLCTTF